MHKHLWICDGCGKEAKTEMSRADPPAGWVAVEIFRDGQDENGDPAREDRLYCGPVCVAIAMTPRLES